MKLNILTKLLAGFISVLILTGAIGGIEVFMMNRLNTLNNQMIEGDITAIYLAQEASKDSLIIARAWRTAVIYIGQPDKAADQLRIIEEKRAYVDDNLAKLKILLSAEDREARARLAEIETKWAAYNTALEPLLEDIRTDDLLGVRLVLDSQTTAGNEMLTAIEALNQYLTQRTQAIAASNTATFEASRTLLIGLVVAAVLLGLGLAFSLARPISKAAKQMAAVADGISRGELEHTITVKSKDELGEIALAFNRMVAYLQEIAGAADRLAQGDLTHELEPQSDRDVLGNAFVQMNVKLRHLIGRVSENAQGIGAAANRLTMVSDQAGQATSQIATTIQQVAQGTAQQTQSLTQAADSVQQMSRAVDGVARGAQDQATAVVQSSEMSNKIATAIQQVTHNARAGAKGAVAAAQTARSGAATVEATLRGMEAIQQKVDQSVQKVREMGQRSDQIGAIVETIEDIASQTNLLALNAAIEAARAGEHGKGFSVVADEVRKLAEKSASATKEIATLVKGIQQTVDEAVTAMEEGAAEVAVGTHRADEAGQALQQILQAVQAVSHQVEEISSAAEQMSSSSQDLIKAMDSVSAVVEANTTATEEMAANSGEVTRLIEDVVSVSEENSAAAEEVSASAIEMNDQLEGVIASVQSLNGMAQQLQQLVAQFMLSDISSQPLEGTNQIRVNSGSDSKMASKKVVWNDSMATGIPEIDQQHQRLIAELNHLVEALSQGQARHEIKSTLDFLENYTKTHFDFEENCMEQHACPVAAKNKKQHAMFLQTLQKIVKNFEQGGASAALAIQVEQELSNWLLQHISKVDYQLHDCTNQQLQSNEDTGRFYESHSLIRENGRS